MSGLSALFERLAEWAGERSGQNLEKVGAKFLEGAAKRGTFERGRDMARNDAGLARQFDWTPERTFEGVVRLRDPGKAGNDVFVYKDSPLGVLKDYLGQEEAYRYPGYRPYVGALPQDASSFHIYDTGPLDVQSGQGAGAYQALFGHTMNEPGAYNLVQSLSGPNQYRRNFNQATAIMRRPDAGGRLLPSPEQFGLLDIPLHKWADQSPEYQVGALQTEGALQTIQNIISRASMPSTSRPVAGLLTDKAPSFSSEVRGKDLYDYLLGMRAAKVPSAGERTLRKLGIVNDVMSDRPVRDDAFRNLEFCQGGLARYQRS